MHHSVAILVLPNAWDAASARILEAAGARAIGTTSMGISASLGFPDVQQISLEQMLESVARIAAAVDIPVTADMESGYGTTPDEAARSIVRAVECGVVGVNIEDGTGNERQPLLEPRILAERINAIRAATDALGMHLTINARTDVFLAAAGSPEERLSEAVTRGNMYRAAGADCVFVPGGLEREVIQTLVREIDAPINVVANPAISIPVVPSVPELQDLGVKRVSVGSGLMRAALAFIDRAAREVLGRGTYEVLQHELGRPDAQRCYETAIGAGKK